MTAIARALLAALSDTAVALVEAVVVRELTPGLPRDARVTRLHGYTDGYLAMDYTRTKHCHRLAP